MGSDAEHKNEIDPALVARAAPYVADRLSQTRRLGELHHAIAGGMVDPSRDFAELGAVIAGIYNLAVKVTGGLLVGFMSN